MCSIYAAIPKQKLVLFLNLIFLMMPTAVSARNNLESVLYAFPHGNGAYPYSGLISDAAGNLYGTTYDGGTIGWGAIFELAPNGTEKLLYSFGSQTGDGTHPTAGLAMDGAGNLYGTAPSGGSDMGICGAQGCGTIFEVTPTGTEKVLYSFTGGDDGLDPNAGVFIDKDLNLYGTALQGGNQNCEAGCGTVVKLTPGGKVTILHSFLGGDDGSYPDGALIRDTKGDLYGTTMSGGSSSCNGLGCGTVFEIARNGTETVVHAFTGAPDGFEPQAGLIVDKSGNLFGTTSGGGSYNRGIVFKIAPDGSETILYTFKGGNDGSAPMSGVVEDRNGNLFGTTEVGGSTRCYKHYGCGTVFELSPDGTETVLHSFTGGRVDGALPYGGLLRDKSGNLFGTTYEDGRYHIGTIFEITN